MEPSLSDYLDSTAYLKIADSSLYDDYAPTRDRSEGPSGSIFTYKSMAYENAPTPGSRGSLDRYVAMVFGETVNIEGKNPAVLCLKCPSELKCSIKVKYEKQLKALREPMDHDQVELGGIIDHSWFGDATGLANGEGQIYVKLETGPQFESDFRRDFTKGEIVAIWASLKRIDCEFSGQLHKSYVLESDFYIPVSTAQADKGGADYVCDLNAGECDFC
ncbi:hypothetical protein C8R47DRAFT_1221428 [Mycena vitilis]|nr:hypothetical protein C8R47DRAFT_1221428 [Mycena vitilis]